MATINSEPAGGLQTPPPGSRAQLVAAFHPASERVDRPSDPTEHEISFGPFRLFPARRLLLERDKPVDIGGRALDLLIALVERPGEVLDKAELIAKVWPHTFIDEGNLKVRIAALRRVLADGQAGNRYISTVVGRGYCFAASITQSAAPRPRQRGTRRRNLPATFRCRWCD
jgi:DNA-binding winged helix-turn-helix (wHTH) protein